MKSSSVLVASVKEYFLLAPSLIKINKNITLAFGISSVCMLSFSSVFGFGLIFHNKIFIVMGIVGFSAHMALFRFVFKQAKELHDNIPFKEGPLRSALYKIVNDKLSKSQRFLQLLERRNTIENSQNGAQLNAKQKEKMSIKAHNDINKIVQEITQETKKELRPLANSPHVLKL